MSRWIDADALKTNINTTFWSGIEKVIDSAPSIDIEPNRGEWIVYEGGWKDFDYYPPKCKCNQCGYEEELYILNAKPTNFCPNCGASMKGADDE